MPDVSFLNKLGNRLIIFLLIPIVCLVIFFGIIIYYIIQTGFQEQFARRLITIGKAATIFLETDNLNLISKGDEDLLLYKKLHLKLLKLRNLNEASRIYVFNTKNEILVDSLENVKIRSFEDKHLFYSTEISDCRKKGASSTLLYKRRDGQFYMTAFVQMSGNNKALMVGVEGSAYFFQILEAVRDNILKMVLITIIFIIIISSLFSKGIIRPIRKLIFAIQNISEGKTEYDIIQGGNDEIGYLTVKFNEMQKKIVERDNRLKLMLSGIAHEVRNPLGGIELFIGLLEDEIKDRENGLKFLGKIKHETGNLKNIVSEFLSYAKHIEIEKKAVNLKDFFKEIVPFFSEELEAKKIKLRLFENNPVAYFDPVHMRRAFMNIISNSIQAITGDSGEITIEVINEKRLKSGKYEEWTIIIIKDNGCGIDIAVRDKIFNPFFTTKEKGTGLGLAFVKKIVDEHDGEISVRSYKGKGTSIYINFSESSDE